ncbi:MAG: UDP-N-acetylglucosamine 2-epimerase (non-hydrolyzing) [bacterium]
MKLVTIVGARPQFVKAAAISREIARRTGGPEIRERLVHTGQHYDYELSAVFFEQLSIAPPAHHLGVGSGPHGAQTGEMLRKIEVCLQQEQPDLVVVHGDTNSTLAGALAAAKLHLPVAHVEAGLRSFNRAMPEELNRVLTDHLARWLFCPSDTAVTNLRAEGVVDGVHQVGDVMYDVLLLHRERAQAHRPLLGSLGVRPRGFALATVHRPENTDDPTRLRSIFETLDELAAGGLPVILPLHPRTRAALQAHGVSAGATRLIDPVSYEEMLLLLQEAHVLLTDSGGLQKEAYWSEVPCVTLRDETEWVETVEAGWNTVVGADPARIRDAVAGARRPTDRVTLYGDGHAAAAIVDVLAASAA